jgi:2-phosphosulfolactate phosphatase
MRATPHSTPAAYGRAVPRFLPRWEIAEVRGAVVAVDVLRAFTTAAYAFAAGARGIHLAGSVEEALAFKAEHPGVLAMGEEGGRRPEGFDLSNSPVAVAGADLDGREIVQRTGAGVQGLLAAISATRLWAASLVCASATARAVNESGLGEPAYVITGRFPDVPPDWGDDDLATAELIERARVGAPLDADATATRVATSDEAARTLAVGEGHVHPDDIAYATRVDAFAFAMEATRVDGGVQLHVRR